MSILYSKLFRLGKNSELSVFGFEHDKVLLSVDMRDAQALGVTIHLTREQTTALVQALTDAIDALEPTNVEAVSA